MTIKDAIAAIEARQDTPKDIGKLTYKDLVQIDLDRATLLRIVKAQQAVVDAATALVEAESESDWDIPMLCSALNELREIEHE